MFGGKTISENKGLALPLFGSLLLLLSLPFWCMVILWQDKGEYWDDLVEWLKKRGGGRIDI